MLMTIREFKALNWKKQNALLEPYVLNVLRTMKEPLPTTRLMRQVAHDMGWLDDNHEYLPKAAAAIGAVLRRFTMHQPVKGMVLQNGETFEAYGKELVRYMWQPLGRREDQAIIDDVFS